MNALKRILLLTLAPAALAQAQLLAPAPKPGDETPRADVSRKAPTPLPAPALLGPDARSGKGKALPPLVQPAAQAACCTQTEDDVYIGRKADPRTLPAKAVPSARAALKPPKTGNRARATGDEDEMDDLDVQRRKAQGLPDNKPSTPRSGAKPGDETPQTERR